MPICLSLTSDWHTPLIFQTLKYFGNLFWLPIDTTTARLSRHTLDWVTKDVGQNSHREEVQALKPMSCSCWGVEKRSYASFQASNPTHLDNFWKFLAPVPGLYFSSFQLSTEISRWSSKNLKLLDWILLKFWLHLQMMSICRSCSKSLWEMTDSCSRIRITTEIHFCTYKEQYRQILHETFPFSSCQYLDSKVIWKLVYLWLISSNKASYI